jgi:hypothetical protein
MNDFGQNGGPGGFGGNGGFGPFGGPGLGDDLPGFPDNASYSFTISNGSVTAEQRVFGTHSVSVTLSSADSFTVGTGTVTETVTSSTATETITFSLESGSTSLYQITQENYTITTPGTATQSYSFTVSGGTVTAETITTSHGSTTVTHAAVLPSDAVFTVGTASITETYASGNEVTTLTFTQPSGSTSYALASEQVTVIPEGTAATQLSIDLNDRIEFSVSSAGAVTAVSAVSPNGVVTALTVPSNVTYTQLATGFIQETVTNGSSSHYEIFYSPTGSGIYTEIAHGTGTVDLTGLKAQLADLPSTVIALL